MQEEFPTALDCFRKALKLQPENIEILEAYGGFLADIGQQDEAIKVSRRHCGTLSRTCDATITSLINDEACIAPGWLRVPSRHHNLPFSVRHDALNLAGHRHGGQAPKGKSEQRLRHDAKPPFDDHRFWMGLTTPCERHPASNATHAPY